MDASKLTLQVVIIVILLILLSECEVSTAQQSYVNNKQLDCYNGKWNYTTKGYICNNTLINNKPSCQSYLTFRSTPAYNTPLTISYLLNNHSSSSTVSASSTTIATLNNITSDVTIIPENMQLVIPVNCSCTGSYYQYNATYALKTKGETYLKVANNTYQGLSTCQAMMDQNPYESHHLIVGLDLIVPLRCACPSLNQSANGVKYLLSYIIASRDTIDSIADLFNVDQDSIRNANEITGDYILPYTPLLIPLTSEATKIQTPVASPPPESPPESPPVGDSNSGSSSKKWVFVGIGIGAAVLIGLAGFIAWFCRRRCADKEKLFAGPVLSPPKIMSDQSTNYMAGDKSSSVPFSLQGVRYAIESLTLYKFEDLKMATGNFSENNKVQGSVYQGLFKGDVAAVKVMKGDVTSEINLLKKINHSNIVRLSGFCVHDGNTYLVYEYAENGSLSNCLHLKKKYCHTWKQRVQIAYDISDALNYLHNYTNPPYIHKNLNTTNVLLDGNFRAKLANFGWARMVEENDDGGLQLTRHVVGTYGYLAPEYIENGVITPKLDVYAFGVVVLELLSGKEATDGDELLSVIIVDVLSGENVKEKLHDFIDPSMGRDYPLDLAFSVAQLAKLCVAKDLNSRPGMPEVVMTLSKILSSSLDWDSSDELDHSNSMMSIGDGSSENSPQLKIMLMLLYRLNISSSEIKRDGVFFISGDVHFGEITRYDCGGVGYPLYDITASGITQAVEKVVPSPLRFIVRFVAWLIPSTMRVINQNCRYKSCTYGQPNFGAIEINWDSSLVTLKLQVRDTDGFPVTSVNVSIPELQISNVNSVSSAKAGIFERHCTLESSLPWIVRRCFAILFYSTFSALFLSLMGILVVGALCFCQCLRKCKDGGRMILFQNIIWFSLVGSGTIIDLPRCGCCPAPEAKSYIAPDVGSRSCAAKSLFS
ncbi:hypothetical protein ACFE04_011682 [Oxalis oulophora]